MENLGALPYDGRAAVNVHHQLILANAPGRRPLRRRTMTRSRSATVGLVSAGLALMASAAVVVALPAGAATAGCSVNYAVSSQWQGGFGASVSITNLGDPVSGWTLTWSYPA